MVKSLIQATWHQQYISIKERILCGTHKLKPEGLSCWANIPIQQDMDVAQCLPSVNIQSLHTCACAHTSTRTTHLFHVGVTLSEGLRFFVHETERISAPWMKRKSIRMWSIMDSGSRQWHHHSSNKAPPTAYCHSSRHHHHPVRLWTMTLGDETSPTPERVDLGEVWKGNFNQEEIHLKKQTHTNLRKNAYSRQ